MKIWCEKCKGRGELTKQSVVASFYFVKCPRCEGMGYTENKEVERLARIGKATEKLLASQVNGCMIPNSGEVIIDYAPVVIKNTEKLLEWSEREG